MQIDLNKNRYAAYFLSCVAASLCFVIYTSLSAGIANFESATNNSLQIKALHLIAMSGLLFFVSLVFSLVIAALPFFIAFTIAFKFKIENPFYFLFGGVLTGIVSTTVLAAIPFESFNDQGFGVSFLEKVASYAPMCGLSGLVAGLTVLLMLRKKGDNEKT